MSDFDLDLMAPIAARIVPLYGKVGGGRVVLVDEADHDLVMQYRWTGLQNLSATGERLATYAVTHVRRDGKEVAILMHSLLTGWPLVDHANHEGLDNRRLNLRGATHSQSLANRRKQPGCSSQFKGVFWDQEKRAWVARIHVNHHRTYLGSFRSDITAARAYDVAAIAAWGEYAYTNFPVADYAEYSAS